MKRAIWSFLVPAQRDLPDAEANPMKALLPGFAQPDSVQDSGNGLKSRFLRDALRIDFVLKRALEDQDSREQAVKVYGKEFLGDEERVFASEVFRFEKALDELEMLLLFPSKVVEFLEVLRAVCGGIDERCGVDRRIAVWQPDLDDPQGDRFRRKQAVQRVFSDIGRGRP